jgi:perosamine synthetase
LNGIVLEHTPSEIDRPALRVPIPLCEPCLQGNEWRYLKDCLDTNWVSSVGPFVDRFESMLAEIVGAKHSVATTSGTAALHIALLVAGVQPDDEVLVSTLTFIAPANAIRYCGAWPVFIDAEPIHWQMDPEKVSDFLSSACHWVGGELRNKTTGRRVKAILPVHILGHPVDMTPIIQLARSHRLAVVEDASEGLGATYKDDMVGHLGDIACFSFNGNKIITTGGGGMITTDNEAWASKAKYLITQAKDDPIEYIHHEIGFNYRLSNIHAALGCAQLEHLADYIATKRKTAAIYRNSLQKIPGITCLPQAPWAFSTFWLNTIRIDEDLFGMNSRRVMQCLAKRGIQTRPLWQPVHMSPAYATANGTSYPIAERLYDEALSLPSSVGLGGRQHEIIQTLTALSAMYHKGALKG